MCFAVKYSAIRYIPFIDYNISQCEMGIFCRHCFWVSRRVYAQYTGTHIANTLSWNEMATIYGWCFVHLALKLAH